jgi:3'-phosphoadenosine 5'-phosphosulfate sulfotransferase (PAPS reductase)/FAD synthetase
MNSFTPPSAHTTTFQEIKDGLRRLYLEDPRPWLVGFSGGKACPECNEGTAPCWRR